MSQKDKQKIFDMLFDEIQRFINLDFYHISFDFDRDEEDTYTASLEKCDYTHFTAHITYSNDVWIKIGEDIDAVILLTIHEMCHIFTSMGNHVMLKEKEYLEAQVGINPSIDLINKITAFEEQMTNVLDKVLFREFCKTKEYKDIIKQYNLIK